MSVTYVLFTGGFDPIHSGHINAIRQSALLGSVIVAPNSDDWLQKKKGAPFQPIQERAEIIRNIQNVSGVLTGWDDSDGTACGAIKMFYETYSSANRNILLFANGGDRTPYTVSKEEIELCCDLGILPIFNVGGLKTRSSSTFLQEWMRRV